MRPKVLFLPINEIHDLGLAFLNYEILSKGYRTIYLGESVPLDSLELFTSNSEKVIFVSYFTVAPAAENVVSYLQNFKEKILEQIIQKKKDKLEFAVFVLFSMIALILFYHVIHGTVLLS